MAQDNRTIGKFQLTGIPPAPRGVPQVEVTFDIDANGILHVSAKDKATGKEQKIRIEASSGLGDKDIDKMVKDAEAHAAEDKRRREEIERRNRLDTLVYEVEKSSKEWVDKLDAALKTRLDKAVEGAKQALRSGAGDEISKALEELQQAYSAAGASLYAAQRGAGAPGGGAEQPAGGEAGGAGGAGAGAEKRTTWSMPTTRSWMMTRRRINTLLNGRNADAGTHAGLVEVWNSGGDRLRFRTGVRVDPQSAEEERRGGDAGRAPALFPAGPGGAGVLGAGPQVGG